MNTPGEISGFLFYPHVGQVTIEGPFNAAGAADTASRRKIFAVPALGHLSSEARVRAHHRLHAREACVPSPGDEGGRRRADGVLPGRPRRWRHRLTKACSRRCSAILADPEFLYRGEREPAARRAGHAVSRERSGARVQVVVLPLEQHPGRRADRSGGGGQAPDSGGARAADQADAQGSAQRCAGHQLHGTVAERAVAEDQRTGTSTCSPISTTTCARHFSARSSCSSAASCRKTAACSTC